MRVAFWTPPSVSILKTSGGVLQKLKRTVLVISLLLFNLKALGLSVSEWKCESSFAQTQSSNGTEVSVLKAEIERDWKRAVEQRSKFDTKQLKETATVLLRKIKMYFDLTGVESKFVNPNDPSLVIVGTQGKGRSVSPLNRLAQRIRGEFGILDRNSKRISQSVQLVVYPFGNIHRDELAYYHQSEFKIHLDIDTILNPRLSPVIAHELFHAMTDFLAYNGLPSPFNGWVDIAKDQKKIPYYDFSIGLDEPGATKSQLDAMQSEEVTDRRAVAQQGLAISKALLEDDLLPNFLKILTTAEKKNSFWEAPEKRYFEGLRTYSDDVMLDPMLGFGAKSRDGSSQWSVFHAPVIDTKNKTLEQQFATYLEVENQRGRLLLMIAPNKLSLDKRVLSQAVEAVRVLVLGYKDAASHFLKEDESLRKR